MGKLKYDVVAVFAGASKLGKIDRDMQEEVESVLRCDGARLITT